MQISPRLGTFFILVSLALLILFVGSVLSKDTNAVFLVAAIPAFLLGTLLRRRTPTSDSGRFRTIRRVSERNRLRREEQKNRKSKPPSSITHE